jgi:serine/threonine-protein kinase
LSAPAPTRLGKYEIVKELGAGAMGVVYLAYDATIERQVAIKTIRKDLLDAAMAEKASARFRQEAMGAGRLTHAGIVTVYEYGEEANVAYIVMEYAPGVDLAHHAASRRLELPEIAGIMTQLLDALAYAHDAGVVHRDIKPSNILLSGRVKITDFGIARIASSQLTQVGMAMGTPAYMAPEQYMGIGVDHRVDLFASGVLLYELLTGQQPFTGETIQEIAYKVCHVEPTLASRLRPGLPAAVDALLATALAKNKELRYPGARELSRAVAAALAGGESSGAPLLETRGAIESAATVSFAGQKVTSGALSGTPTNVTPEAIERVTRTLAKYVGPIAKVMVKKAGAEAKTYRDLCLGVSERLSADEKARFLSEVGLA